jgi:hypothetical protein
MSDSDRIAELEAAISEAVDEARSVCGGDGKGCEPYRTYNWPIERRWRKCGQCPMDTLSGCLEALNR